MYNAVVDIYLTLFLYFSIHVLELWIEIRSRYFESVTYRD